MFKPWSKWVERLEQKITRVSDQTYGPEFFSLRQLLVLASVIYKAGALLRLRLYARGLLKEKQLSCFVISIGNILAGGAGKTPMAIYLAQLLAGMGKRAVVVSRGYKGSLRGTAIVGDGDTLFLSTEEAGDEPAMMAARNSFPVVVGKDRYKAGRLAMEQLNPDVIILDDGFQHLRLKKDLSILLFDHDRPLGNSRILPAGRLRETPAMSKNRCHALVFTRCPHPLDPAGPVKEIIGQYGNVPFFATRHAPFLLHFLPGGKKTNPAMECPRSLDGRSGILVSGIAANDSFGKAAKELGVNVMDHLEFKDHYRYKGADILRIGEKAGELGLDLILTTEKDWVKLGPDNPWETDLAVIGIQIEFEDAGAFETFIRSRLDL